MHFAYPFPWWAVVLVVAAAAGLASLSYVRPLVPLSAGRRATLGTLRGLTLLLLALCLFRPVWLLPPRTARDAIVPILVDASRSMRLTDGESQSRLQRARAIVRDRLQPLLAGEFQTKVFSFGDRLETADVDRLAPDEPASNLSAALAAVRARFRGQRVAGIVVLSDGGVTGSGPVASRDPGAAPVYTISLGTSRGLRDRAVVGLSAGEARLEDSTVDLSVSAVSRGFGREPFELRVLADGRPVETRRVVPAADGAPVQETFTVSPDAKTPTVYTVEIPGDPDEPVTENNRRAVLVPPAGRKRRILLVEGAPGFEHSSLLRALSLDPGLAIDVVVRKGQDAGGRGTFLIQASPTRAPALRDGYPSTAGELDAYDAIILANTTADEFTHPQMEMTSDFVSRRGGGLLMFGGRSFVHHSFLGTPIDAALPLELNGRQGGVTLTGLTGERLDANKVVPTADGLRHPVMRLGRTAARTRARWAALPALAATAVLGAPRPGARVLAVTSAPGGTILPVVAVQRYGRGRSMVFAGEASWRWRMLMPSTDRTYEIFWRQVVRWLAAEAPDPVTVTAPAELEPGDRVPVDVTVRNAAYEPVGQASIRATVIGPGGTTTVLRETPADPAEGRYRALVGLDRPGLYEVTAEATHGGMPLGQATRWLLVGGLDREFADPRIDEEELRRLAVASGGRYLSGPALGRLPGLLAAGEPVAVVRGQRDLWDTPWVILALIALLSVEWGVRRRWGLR